MSQLAEKNLHLKDDGSYQQSVDYRYNIRGWLTSINNSQLTNDGITNDDGNDYFGFELKYNTPTNVGGAAQFNGNISESLWKTMGSNQQSYAYSYDPLNRLKQAKYFDRLSPVNNNRFNEIITGYDRNGNILGLQRGNSATGLMDNLSYSYSGNQLLGVADAGSKTDGFVDGSNTDNDYAYDANGNMNQDNNKGIGAIAYNFLNLTASVTKSASENMTYTYTAAGEKLSQLINEKGETQTTDYSNGFVYEGGVLQYILHDEGRINRQSNTGAYEYFLKDHLGNVRTTFTSVPQMEAHTATMETEDTEEDHVFINFGNTRIPTIEAINHTPLSETGAVPEVCRLNGYYNINQGPGQSMAVFPGDKIKAQAYVKYLDLRRDNGINSAALVNFLANGIGNFTSSAIDGNTYQITDLSNSGFSAVLGDGTDSDYAPPQAFLNCFFFDKYKNPATAKFAFSKVDETAAITPLNINGAHQLLSLEVEIMEPGFIYIIVSHDAAENIDVYFDDLYVEHQKSYIVQQQDYFAFGMEFNNLTQDKLTSQNYLFNGKEKQKFTGWEDYGARMYMNDIGRWGVVDPEAQVYYGVSSFAYVADNPIRYIDPDGKKIINPNNYVLSNKNFYAKLRLFDAAVARISGKDRNSYSFQISGGDRYKKDDKVYSKTNDEEIENSSKNSKHLQENGGVAVDLLNPDGVDVEDLKKAAKEVGLRYDPEGAYSDGHFHLDADSNSKEAEDYSNDKNIDKTYKPTSTDLNPKKEEKKDERKNKNQFMTWDEALSFIVKILQVNPNISVIFK